MSQEQQIEAFMRVFRSRESACAFGLPNRAKDKVKEDGTVKSGMDYRTEQRPFGKEDARLHLSGRQSIVAIPLLTDGTCCWAALDIDEPCPMPVAGDYFHWFPSKSKGWHGFVFFEKAQPADRVRFYMAEMAELIGHKGCEVFPKQVATGSGNGINLPFFGAKAFDFVPRLWTRDLPEPPKKEDEFQGGDEEGYWTEDGMRAMLAFYAETVPSFEFRPFRGRFSVPCPGYDEGWEDGSKHSANQFPRISHEACVWVNSNGWPKFRCVHAHCDGVKTFNMWRAFWDPLRLWDYGDWLESCLRERGDYVGL